MNPTDSGLAPVNGLDLYWESYGSGGTPLIMLHGGYGRTTMFGDLPERLASERQVIAVDLQGHGRTADTDRPLTYEAMGDDIAALVEQLGLGPVDLLGYSLGGGTALRAAIQHPALVRRLVVVSTPFSSDGWYPDIRAQMKQMSSAGFDFMRQTPLYTDYAAVAPDPDHFPALMDKMGALLGADYDWSAEVTAMAPQTLIIFADGDSVPISYVADFFRLLGGGLRDGSWDRSGMPTHRLTVLPDTTHYDIVTSPALEGLARTFLA